MNDDSFRFSKLAGFALAAATLAGAAAPGYGEELSPLTGKTGQIVQDERVRNPGTTGFLQSLMILESADHPCIVQLYGDDLTVDRYEGRINQCKDFGSNRGKGIDATKGRVAIRGGGVYITGLNVCLSSSNRVKGWTIYGKSVQSPNTVSDSFKRANCPANGWQQRSDCPAGMKAVGVQAMFEPGRGTISDSLSGMRLICM